MQRRTKVTPRDKELVAEAKHFNNLVQKYLPTSRLAKVMRVLATGDCANVTPKFLLQAAGSRGDFLYDAARDICKSKDGEKVLIQRAVLYKKGFSHFKPLLEKNKDALHFYKTNIQSVTLSSDAMSTANEIIDKYRPNDSNNLRKGIADGAIFHMNFFPELLHKDLPARLKKKLLLAARANDLQVDRALRTDEHSKNMELFFKKILVELEPKARKVDEIQKKKAAVESRRNAKREAILEARERREEKKREKLLTKRRKQEERKRIAEEKAKEKAKNNKYTMKELTELGKARGVTRRCTTKEEMMQQLNLV